MMIQVAHSGPKRGGGGGSNGNDGDIATTSSTKISNFGAAHSGGMESDTARRHESETHGSGRGDASTRGAASVPPDLAADAALELMGRENLEELRVIADGRLEGVVTRSFLIRQWQLRREWGT